MVAAIRDQLTIHDKKCAARRALECWPLTKHVIGCQTVSVTTMSGLAEQPGKLCKLQQPCRVESPGRPRAAALVRPADQLSTRPLPMLMPKLLRPERGPGERLH